MQWTEYILKINIDDIDLEAIGRYDQWRSQIIEEVDVRIDRKHMIYFYGFDPDILNEFCFYEPEYWDRLIDRAKMFSKEEDFSLERKMQRAIMIKFGTDPDVLPDDDMPSIWYGGNKDIPNLWRSGKDFINLSKGASQFYNDDSISLDNIAFTFNRFSGAGAMAINDGSGREIRLKPSDFVYPPDILNILFPEDDDTENVPQSNEDVDLLNKENIDDESGWLPM